MMNGDFVAEATSLEDSRTLRAVIDFPAMTSQQKVETLFLASLGRTPTKTERERFEKYVETGGPTGDQKKAFADVFWALLNSSEFLLNH